MRSDLKTPSARRLRAGLTNVVRIGLIASIALGSPGGASPLSDDASASAKIPGRADTGSDIPAKWHEPVVARDYVRRDVMIPMRDGVKLHTVIATPTAARGLPMLFERTPYNAAEDIDPAPPHLHDAVWSADRDWVDAGYIIVAQDLRGKYGSQGTYVMTRPPIGPLNPTTTDDTTDAYDTIDWLVKHVPESNGRVGMIGTSYDGWSVAMALLGPHLALKVAVVESPMIDGWMGDDFFHNGAFRQSNFDWLIEQTSQTGKGVVPPRGEDDYRNFLDAGSAGDWGHQNGFEQLPFWNRVTAHPAYDSFWQGQALDKALAAKPSTVPTLWLQGLWDQADIYGALHSWEALKAQGHAATNHLAIGPWSHSQIAGSADHLGPLKWKGDTAADFRTDVLIPFFDTYLKNAKPEKPLAPVLVYDPVGNHWDSFADWPAMATLTPMYLQADYGLSTATAEAGEDQYLSDPAKPVPFMTPPLMFRDTKRWATWLVQDQRPMASRPDVLSYQTPVLDRAVTVRGNPVADIFAKTTGTDGDFVVKIIDVYPPTLPGQPEMAGYQLPVSLDIFRGRYRASFEMPTPIPAGQIEEYKFRLPTLNYVFKPGHRIMVQIQSSLFPLYDRNPQSYVPNIFFAKPDAYRKATISIARGPGGASSVLLPIVQESVVAR